MELKGKTVMVTGGASGLGEACVRRLISEGASAAVVDLDGEKGRRLADELGSQVVYCETDVTDESSVQAAIDQTLAAFEAALVEFTDCRG